MAAGASRPLPSVSATPHHDHPRCQSANPDRPHRGIPAGPRECRSRSGEPRRTQPPRPPSGELPIPGGDRTRSPDAQDAKDLTKLYDHATWNMYARIVSARRQRLQAGPAGAGPTPAAKPAPAHDADSLAGQTADETDKSSTASSSWSRMDSPGRFPTGAGGSFLPVFEPPSPAGSSLGPGGTEAVEHQEGTGEEDSFIFELDM